MSNNKFPFTPELKPFQDADDAWNAEIKRQFGQRSNARYENRGKGEPGSKLRKLHEARAEARRKWLASAS